eukprot:TRINITY_DN17665_c0_g1_i1.p1 TRINITY_DN17665_c0_g1~~TRINITY_DN17665_c0_g1_i1.p1  ORF type:complete len:707 (+),score=161.18 TRINITY_DN17665_c0_g1_i1:52-2172(+)
MPPSPLRVFGHAAHGALTVLLTTFLLPPSAIWAGVEGRAVVRREVLEANEKDSSRPKRRGDDKDLVPKKTGVFVHEEANPMCDNCKETYYKMDGDGNAWALVLKLSGAQMCFGSSKWNDMLAFNHGTMQNASFPKPGEPDGKAYAFHKLQGVNTLKFENSGGKSVVLNFGAKGSPQDLMTTNAVPFAAYPDWHKWKAVFAPELDGYDHAPAFMRNGMPTVVPKPPCREGTDINPEGCAAKCMFCFYAGKGKDCPGTGKGDDDVTIGIGMDKTGCEVADNTCSAAPYVDKKRFGYQKARSILVWAKVADVDLLDFQEMGKVDVAMQAEQAQKEEAASVPPAPAKNQGEGKNQKPDLSTIPNKGGVFNHKKHHRMCANCGKVLYRFKGGDAMALVMRLGGNQFCYNDPKWRDGMEFGAPELMLNDSMPEYGVDAKSQAFHLLKGVTQIILETGRGGEIIIPFAEGGTPEELLLTSKIKMLELPSWGSWHTAFGSRGQVAPLFIRGGSVVEEPMQTCRTENQEILGCGRPCVLCYQINVRETEEGAGCPARAFGNDYSTGIGLSVQSPHCCMNVSAESDSPDAGVSGGASVAEEAEKKEVKASEDEADGKAAASSERAEAEAEASGSAGGEVSAAAAKAAIEAEDPGQDPLPARKEGEMDDLEIKACTEHTKENNITACSASTPNSGKNRVLVWAKVTAAYMEQLSMPV